MIQKKQDLKENNFTEAHLQLAWNKLKVNKPLPVISDNEWILLSPGSWNLEAGPDFLNAKFSKNGHIITGDVEIHKKTSDWAIHGHYNDKRSHHVILHVVAKNDSSQCSSEIATKLPDIPLMQLDHVSTSARIALSDKFPRGKCENIFAAMNDTELKGFFEQAGMKRFSKKVEVLLGDMCAIGVHSTFLQRIFDACGYKKNRTQFKELFSRVSTYKNLSSDEAEVVLWGESGLIPDPVAVTMEQEMEHFVTSLWSKWWAIRQSAADSINWSRTGIRPMNSPERRIASLNVLLQKMGINPLLTFAKLIKHSTDERNFIQRVNQVLQCKHPLWDQYYSFTTKATRASAILGANRAADICVNIILPALKAYFIMTGDNESGEFVERTFRKLPKNQSNRILKIAALKWFMPPARQKNIFTNAITQQGAIHIYHHFCEETCAECKICPLRELLVSQK